MTSSSNIFAHYMFFVGCNNDGYSFIYMVYKVKGVYCGLFFKRNRMTSSITTRFALSIFYILRVVTAQSPLSLV